MLVPAAIYLAINDGAEGSHGWGIPVATDIAFSLGVLALLGRRAPFALKTFLLALAIADDLGAIAVIAIFYSESVALGPVAWALGLVVLIAACGMFGIRSVTVYVALGVLLWLAVYKSGIHATVAGVALAALTPVRPYYAPGGFETAATGLIRRFRSAPQRGESDEAEDALRQVEFLARESIAPLDRLERALHPWVSYAIVPVFALANAGVSLSPNSLTVSSTSAITAGVAFGLVVGKPVGVVLFAWLALKLGLGSLPRELRFIHLVGAGLVAGIGFTVSLFITGLAFAGQTGLQEEAKVGIPRRVARRGARRVHISLDCSGQDAAEAARSAPE